MTNTPPSSSNVPTTNSGTNQRVQRRARRITALRRPKRWQISSRSHSGSASATSRSWSALPQFMAGNQKRPVDAVNVIALRAQATATVITGRHVLVQAEADRPYYAVHLGPHQPEQLTISRLLGRDNQHRQIAANFFNCLHAPNHDRGSRIVATLDWVTFAQVRAPKPYLCTIHRHKESRWRSSGA